MNASALHIRRIDTIPVELPLKRPLLSFAGRRTEVRCLVVRVEAESGAIGWGEAGESLTMTGETLASMQVVIERHFTPLLLGQDARARLPLMHRLAHVIHGNSAAKAALDMALLDLLGHHLGVPAADLLGGTWRDAVRPLWFLGNGATDLDLAEAMAKRSQGYSSFKIKAAVDPVEQDIERVRALREALGPEVELSVDANMGWDVRTARRFVEAVAGLDLLFVEQPVRHDDLNGMAAVAGASGVAIGSDEGIHGLADIQAHYREGAAAGVSLKPCKAGGVAEVVRLAAVCDALGISVHIASLIESSIATAAVLQAGCAASRLDWGISLTNHYLAEDLVTDPLTLCDGAMRRPSGPGLGITVDPAKVERFRLR